MPYYETVFIARQEFSTTQMEGLTEKLADTVRKNGGTIAKQEYWGVRNLAYPMRKNSKGHYTLFHIDGSSDAMNSLDRALRLDEDVLRHLTIRLEVLDAKPSVMMQARSGPEDRRPPRGAGGRPPRGDGQYRSHHGDAGSGRGDGASDVSASGENQGEAR